ncbi:hypothetical protein DL95DRAFT_398991 [Leptodontidium sp. 2 PMI_412]|nr:hypothetical protein DL95DRAFT_398991 [Leptodontidium sp. 2 PMI_412]
MLSSKTLSISMSASRCSGRPVAYGRSKLESKDLSWESLVPSVLHVFGEEDSLAGSDSLFTKDARVRTEVEPPSPPRRPQTWSGRSFSQASPSFD